LAFAEEPNPKSTALSTHDTREAGRRAEVAAIAEHAPTLNRTRGGNYDAVDGAAIFWAAYSADPDMAREYGAKLSAALAESDTPEHLTARVEAARRWREANPRKAYQIQRRATRIAARKAGGLGYAEPIFENKLQRHLRYGREVSAAWFGRTQEARDVVKERISESVAKHYAQKTPEEKAVHLARLAKAREGIDISKRNAAIRAAYARKREAKEAARANS
jgi:hypothetical protein